MWARKDLKKMQVSSSEQGQGTNVFLRLKRRTKCDSVFFSAQRSKGRKTKPFSLECKTIIWWNNCCRKKNSLYLKWESYEMVLLLMTFLMRNISFRFFSFTTHHFEYLYHTKMLILMSALFRFNHTELGTMGDGSHTAFWKNVKEK